MRRNPKLAHEVTMNAEVAQSRHFAIDKVTAAHLAVDLLARLKNNDQTNDDYVRELEVEEKAIEFMEDAVYWFHKYLRLKLKKYEEALQTESQDRADTIKAGNDLARQHREDLTQFIRDRRVS